MSKQDNLTVIGPSVSVSIDERYIDVPAKIDTGANSSAIWASNIQVNSDGILHFTLFDEMSPYYDGKVYESSDYELTVARSAMGHEQIRYRVYFPIKIADREIRVLFSLADRSKNSFPILIGKRTLMNKFLVDVSLPDVKYERKPFEMEKEIIQEDFQKDPHQFHNQFVKNQNKNTK